MMGLYNWAWSASWENDGNGASKFISEQDGKPMDQWGWFFTTQYPVHQRFNNSTPSQADGYGDGSKFGY